MVKIMMSYIVPSQKTESRNFYSTDIDFRCLSEDDQCVSGVLSLFHDFANGTETSAQSRYVYHTIFSKPYHSFTLLSTHIG
jgi:hypothetical protein